MASGWELPPVDLIAYDEGRRRYLSLAVVGVAALVAAVIGAGAVAIWHVTTSSGSSGRPGGTPSVSGACSQALARADAAIADGQALESALTTQTVAVNDLMAGRITSQQLLDRTLPDLTRGSQRSLQFDQDKAVFRAAAHACRSG
jgi:hypothetical protein